MMPGPFPHKSCLGGRSLNVSLVEDRSASSNELSRLRWRVVGDRARPVRFASPSLSRLSVKTPFSLSYDTDDIHLYTLTRPKEIE